MGKFFDALQKSAFSKDSRAKSQAAESKPPRPKKKTPKTKEIADLLRIEREVCQLLPMDEMLVSCALDDNVEVQFAAEQFRILRNQILFQANNAHCNTIMVTSAVPNEGKSFVASNLAASIANSGEENVLLLECDVRRPSLAKIFGLENSLGLRDYFQKGEEIRNLLTKTPIQNLNVLPAGRRVKNPHDLLTSKGMSRLIKELKNSNKHKYIILDTSPFQVAAETNVLSKMVDGIVLVVGYGKASRKIIKETVEQLGKDKILGIVFNWLEGKYYKKYYYKHYCK